MILGSSFSCIFGLRKFCPLRLLDQDKQTSPFRLFSYIFPVFFVIIVHNSSGLILRAVPICGPNQASGIQRQLIKVKGSRVTRGFASTYFSPAPAPQQTFLELFLSIKLLSATDREPRILLLYALMKHLLRTIILHKSEYWSTRGRQYMLINCMDSLSID